MIPEGFTNRLSEKRRALFAALCPYLRVAVAKLNIKIAKMQNGTRMKKMMVDIKVTELHTVLPLVQGGLAEAIGVSTWTLSTTTKNLIQMKRWPARQYAKLAKEAALLDEDLASEIARGNEVKVQTAATQLYCHIEKYSGIHLCEAVERFRAVDKAMRQRETNGDGEKRMRKRRRTKDMIEQASRAVAQ